MPTSRPFAYNPSPNPLISGTTQVGDIAIGVNPTLDYFGGAGGVQWWQGPDEDLGYIVAKPIPPLNQPNPLFIPAGVAFGRSLFTEEAFILLAESLSSGTTFTSGNDASTWLTSNGYWNTWVFISPTPTPTNTSTPTITPTITPTTTITPTITETPTNTPTPTITETPTNTQTPTPSVTNTQTPTNTSTPTPTSTPSVAPSGLTVNIVESAGNVIMTALGSLNINDLTYITTDTLGGTGIGTGTATFIMGNNGDNYDIYSGFTSTPSSFGTVGGGSSTSSSGDVFGVITQGTPPYLLVVPEGYTTGTLINSNQTFNSATFTSLGLVQGTYTYTWGSGANADEISVIIGNGGATPTPTSTSTLTPTPTSTSTLTPTPTVTKTPTSTPPPTPAPQYYYMSPNSWAPPTIAQGAGNNFLITNQTLDSAINFDAYYTDEPWSFSFWAYPQFDYTSLPSGIQISKFVSIGVPLGTNPPYPDNTAGNLTIGTEYTSGGTLINDLVVWMSDGPNYAKWSWEINQNTNATVTGIAPTAMWDINNEGNTSQPQRFTNLTFSFDGTGATSTVLAYWNGIPLTLKSYTTSGTFPHLGFDYTDMKLYLADGGNMGNASNLVALSTSLDAVSYYPLTVLTQSNAASIYNGGTMSPYAINVGIGTYTWNFDSVSFNHLQCLDNANSNFPSFGLVEYNPNSPNIITYPLL